FYQILVERSPESWMQCDNPSVTAFNPNHPERRYISLQIPRAGSERTTVTIGDGKEDDGYRNVAMELDTEYTLTLRVVSKWEGEFRYQCSESQQIY
ncbi:hypothetical protein scyTo_0024503, partial [Scyliorhinus torazame]|nr:hypothetical protein [Scyliorhinus torazame]